MPHWSGVVREKNPEQRRWSVDMHSVDADEELKSLRAPGVGSRSNIGGASKGENTRLEACLLQHVWGEGYEE